MWYIRLFIVFEELIIINWQIYGIDYDGLLIGIEIDNNVVVLELYIQFIDY